MSNQVIAKLTDASESYVYQLRTAIDEGEIPNEKIEAALDEELQSQYRDRIESLVHEHDISRTIDEGATEEQETSGEDLEAASENPVNASVRQDDHREAAIVPVEEVRRVREVIQGYREDAEFEREHFEGEAKNIAEEKFYISSRAVEMLDQLIED